VRLPRIRLVWPLPKLPRRSEADFGDVRYAPRSNGRADPGEVVWAWVPFEEDAKRGKDRPVLVLARKGRDLLTLPLTSKDHDLDKQQEARVGRYWMDVGTGAWDRSRRPSEVRLDRIVRLRDRDVRREGAAIDRLVFEQVVEAARRHHSV
jgi:hypothetical protein